MWIMPDPLEAYMGGSNYYQPRDFLKFGQLILDGGMWNGRRIVDWSSISDSIVPRTERRKAKKATDTDTAGISRR